ncbi:MAG: glycosyltransferase family 39 protein [Burkholderiales bacterium]|nr:glycosyltransferase family 39 protein [Burkholderiales bacterium]
MTTATLPKRGTLLLLLAALAILWFGNLDYRKLVRPDEGRYAEIPREMAVSGDWLTPRLNGVKYFEKPPLQYWATAAAYEMFGQHHWTVRIWPAATGFAGIVLAYVIGSMLFGALAGLYAALILASSLGYVLVAHVATLDMGLTFFMTLTLGGLLLGLRQQATAAENRLWMHVAWAGMALAALSKGLIGVVLPVMVLAAYIVVQRDFGLLRRLRLWTGGLLFLAIAAPWFVAVSIANPGFFDFFFIHEHFQRFLTKGHRRPGPWWYFFPILALTILPWLSILCDALARSWKARGAAAEFQPQRFLMLWIVLIFAFFSVSGSKLPSYIMPIYPALALLMGLYLSERQANSLRWHLAPLPVLGVVVMALAPQAVRFASDEVPVALYEAYIPWLLATGGVFLCGAGYALYRCWRGGMVPALIVLSFSSLAAGQLAMMGHDSLARSSSAYYLAQEIAPHMKPDAPFYSVGTYEQTLPYYIKRPVTLVAFADEMAYGLAQEPHLGLRDMAEFERAWRTPRYALAMMTPDKYAELVKTGLPMQVIARDTRRVVVTNTAQDPALPVRPTPEAKP